MKKTLGAAMLIAAGFSFSPIAAAVAENVNNVNIDVSANESQWWSTYSVEIKNTSIQAIDMKASTVEFLLPYAINDVNFSSSALSYPSWSIEHEFTAEGVHHKITYKFDNGEWVKSSLPAGATFTLSFGLSGQLDDLAAFEKSIKFNGSGSEQPPIPELELSILSPIDGQQLVINEATEINISVEGELASKVEFWVNSTKLAEQSIEQDITHYSQSWTPSELGDTSINVLIFDEKGQKIEQKSVSVQVESDHEFSAPEVRFITPENGSTFKKTETVSISVDAFDSDDDLTSVVIKANNAQICEFDAKQVDQFDCDWQPSQTGSVTLSATATDEQKLTSTTSVQITVTESNNSCGDVAPYQDGISYQVGDRVSNVGEVFSCKVFGWCGNPVWAPGTGHPNYPDAWKDAWQSEGQCDPNMVPEIGLETPSNGDRLSPNKPFDVIVNATDEDGEVVKVEALLNGKVVATATQPTSGDQYKLTVPGQAEGAYELVTAAYDDKGASAATAPITLAITDRDLFVGLTSPVDGSAFTQGRSIKIAADAESFVGSIQSVTFKANGTELVTLNKAPYEYEWIGAQVGTHTIEAIAVNTEGDTLASPVSTIKVQEAKPETGLRDNPDRSITYLTSWGLKDIEQLQNSQGDAYFLSFGKWDSNGNIQVTDGMIEPSYNESWMAPGYQSWTELKHSHPNKTMMVAFGGQTHEGMWAHMANPATREAIANGLVEMMNKPYPVYKKNLKPEEMVGECLATTWSGECDYSKYQLAGYVSIDGIDFDYEKAARLTEQENRNLEALIDLIRNKVGMSKILSLTTYHVGADPVECDNPSVFENCSYIEPDRSSHNGEVISLLQNTKDSIDFFNVMAYDAGQNFKYDIAMANYAKHVGDPSKIVLGATINKQWGPAGQFVETRENNIDRSKWQKAQGYGGFFIWTLGSNSEGLSMQEQVEYFNEMISHN
ncbi:Ig-like domain-containing protein [Vibrio aestuarianus]|uniref:Ig-like domain-containing protein n=1 Tax=Vibrio aestuarianus TaxID=28171 RepID=UPI00237CBCB6|nr:Ig-like domain-containing protein [Vibrio aestuarianus]MDE1250516.1 Ig-like domain-containing protein [Vibrio aestuarianus]